jgi:hypothetical protein
MRRLLGTVETFFRKFKAIARIMTDSGKGPHIVHCPQYCFPDRISRVYPLWKANLIYPVQVNHIGLLYQRMTGQIIPGICYRSAEKILFTKLVTQKYKESLCYKPEEISLVVSHDVLTEYTWGSSVCLSRTSIFASTPMECRAYISRLAATAAPPVFRKYKESELSYPANR